LQSSALVSIISTVVAERIDRSEEPTQNENTRNAPVGLETRIRWGRVVLAAIMSEVAVVVVLLLASAAYLLLGPPLSDAEMNSLGAEIGYYVAPGMGVVAILLAVLWATRPLERRFVAHGMLVGAGSVLLTVAFAFAAPPEHRVMYVVAFALRLLAGWAGGALAQRRFAAKAANASPAHGTGAAA
jgi:hypothetical protein